MNRVNKIAIALDEANIIIKISLRCKHTHFIKALSLQDFAFHLGSASTYCSKKYLFRRRDQ
jgi:hypothetical protein